MYLLSVNTVEDAEGQGSNTAREKKERKERKLDPRADQRREGSCDDVGI